MQRRLRLRRKDDFARLRQHGRVWRHHMLILSVTPNGLTHNRYGFVTSKHLGKAVVRNRTRRLLRETSHKISVVARECGYGHYSNFFRQFRRHFGMTPAAYRDNISEG